MQKSNSKADKASVYENGLKFQEPPNLEKLSRKMEFFEKTLSKVPSFSNFALLDDKISLFETKSKKPFNETSAYEKDAKYGLEPENNSKIRGLELKINENKNFFTEKLEEIENKISELTRRMEEIQESSQSNKSLERKLLNIEKLLEKVSINQERAKSKDFDNPNDIKPSSKKTDSNDVKFKADTNDLKFTNSDNRLTSRNYDEISKDVPISKSISESKKRSLHEYTKPLDEKDSRVPKEIKEKMEKRDRSEKPDKFEKNEKSEKNDRRDRSEKIERPEKNERSQRTYFESDDFLKNENKYSKTLSKIVSERPYLLEDPNKGSSGNVLRESKQNIRNYSNNAQYNEDCGVVKNSSATKNSKTHSFYLNQDEGENNRERKKSQNSIETVEKQEKRKKIDEEIDKRFNLENEKRQRIIGNIENKRKIDEKMDDFSNSDDEKFKFTPFSTEKSRNKEISSRLKLENKIKDDKISKLTYNIMNK